MWFSVADVMSFWFSPWSLPIRAACALLSEQAHQVANPKIPAPRWSRPLYFYRWLGQAIAERLAQQQAQPGAPRYRFGRRSEPCWSQTITLPDAPRALRKLEHDILLWFLGMHIERCYRVLQTPPSDVGEDLWTQTAMSACQHLAQFYGELKRRYKAQRARTLLQEALQRFLTWDADK